MNPNDLPEITIILGIYKPNLKWLRELLESFNNQEYPNLRLIVWNDCPEEDNHEDIFKECLKRIPFEIHRGEKNLGAMKAYEELTKLVKTEFIAYSDQDDVWLPNKFTVLMEEFMKDDELTLACSDVNVIDGNGTKIASSIREVYHRQIPYEGPDLLNVLLVRCFITGCTILMKTKSAQASLPFPETIFPDYWLGINEAVFGKIKFVKRALINYRIHGNNQSRPMAGIINKNDYYEQRIVAYYNRMAVLKERFAGTKAEPLIIIKTKWAQIRKNYYDKPNISNFLKLLFTIDNNWKISCFELMLPLMPQFIFEKIISGVRENKI